MIEEQVLLRISLGDLSTLLLHEMQGFCQFPRKRRELIFAFQRELLAIAQVFMFFGIDQAAEILIELSHQKDMVFHLLLRFGRAAVVLTDKMANFRHSALRHSLQGMPELLSEVAGGFVDGNDLVLFVREGLIHAMRAQWLFVV